MDAMVTGVGDVRLLIRAADYVRRVKELGLSQALYGHAAGAVVFP